MKTFNRLTVCDAVLYVMALRVLNMDNKNNDIKL